MGDIARRRAESRRREHRAAINRALRTIRLRRSCKAISECHRHIGNHHVVSGCGGGNRQKRIAGPAPCDPVHRTRPARQAICSGCSGGSRRADVALCTRQPDYSLWPCWSGCSCGTDSTIRARSARWPSYTRRTHRPGSTRGSNTTRRRSKGRGGILLYLLVGCTPRHISDGVLACRDRLIISTPLAYNHHSGEIWPPERPRFAARPRYCTL